VQNSVQITEQNKTGFVTACPELISSLLPGARDIPAVSSVLDEVLSNASKLSWEMPRDLPRCEVRIEQGINVLP